VNLPFPLTGVRVIDLTRLLPGAFATLMLAELGAEVIKIEDPRGGDPMRQLPPLVGGRSVYHLLLDRGKKSVALDLKNTGDRAKLDRLLDTADVVIESFRPAAARRLGVSGEQIRAARPRIVHCAITGYGQTGPYAERPGHDLNYVSVSGLLAVDRPTPTDLPRMFIADVGGGAMSAVIAILAALGARGLMGQGATLDISMHEATLYWAMVPAARELVEGGAGAADELPTYGAHACYNVYKTKDDQWLALGALEEKFWRAFCLAIGRDDLVGRHLTAGADQSALLTEVRGIFATRTQADWLTFFSGHDVCLTPVNSPAAAMDDPHIQARGVVGYGAGLRFVRPPFVQHPAPLGPAPQVGEHSGEYC
jgi:crotonobetainyl-CoA:carnitine CoA-transferase CaiB-like acyl-CoA transferase